MSFDVGAAFRQQRLENGLRCLLVQPVLRGRVGRVEGLFQIGHAHPRGAPQRPQARRRPGLSLDHFREQRQSNGDDLAALFQSGERLVKERLLFGRDHCRLLGQGAVGAAEGGQHASRVVQVEEVDRRRVFPLDQPDFELAHEAGRRHPELIAYRDDRLHTLAVALPHRGDQIVIISRTATEEPLLELIQDQQNFLARTQHPASAQGRDAVGQPALGGKVRADRFEPAQYAALGLAGCRLDIDWNHVASQSRQEARFHQRRLAAAGGTVNQPDAKTCGDIGRFDAYLPESQPLGQPVAVARAGQKLEEELSVVLVERSQPLGHNPDQRATARGAQGGCGVREVRSHARRMLEHRPAWACRHVLFEEVPQIFRQVARCAVAVGRPPGHRLEANPFELPGNRVIDLARRARIGGDDLVQQLRPRLRPERPSSGEQLIENNAQAEDVGPSVDPVPFAACLLRTHVRRRAGDLGACAEILVAERQAKVGHTRPSPAVDQDIRRLDVPMDQPAHMCMVERLGNRRRPLRGLARRGPPLLEPRGEVAPLDVLRDHVAIRVVGAADIINRNDVRVIEPGEHPRLGQIRFGILGSGDAFRIGNFDRHTPIEFSVMGEIDPAEGPLAQQAKQTIAADKQLRRKRPGPWGGCRRRSLRILSQRARRSGVDRRTARARRVLVRPPRARAFLSDRFRGPRRIVQASEPRADLT